MADAPEDPIETWRQIAESAETNAFVQTVIFLGSQLGADVSVTLRVPGDDRALTVSFNHWAEDEDEDEEEEDADGA